MCLRPRLMEMEEQNGSLVLGLGTQVTPWLRIRSPVHPHSRQCVSKLHLSPSQQPTSPSDWQPPVPSDWQPHTV